MTFFRELLYPPRCPGCDEIIPQREWKVGYCSKCNREIIRIGDSSCIKCGKPINKGQEEYCADCRKKHHHFLQHKGVYLYGGPMKPAMYRLKYSNRRDYARVFAGDAYDKYASWLQKTGIEYLVPIPMYGRKERQRGYNQAGVIAEELGKLTGRPVKTDLVVRTRNSVPQKGLNDIERKNNLKNAFKIRKSGVKLKKILLIDDIYTTGSTMDEVSKVLRQAGVEQVYGLSICIGEGRELTTQEEGMYGSSEL